MKQVLELCNCVSKRWPINMMLPVGFTMLTPGTLSHKFYHTQRLTQFLFFKEA